MDFQLFVVQGRSTTKTIKLADGVTVVGRQDDCQLRIKSSQVSRKHCELFEKKGLLLVKDLGSSNGTLVNGKRVEESRVLEPGDELSIGPVKLRVGKVGAPPPAAAPQEPGAGAGKKPSDTAITAPPTSADVPDVDEFDIDFEEATEVTELDPVAAPSAKAATPPPAPPKAAEPEVESVDDAVADFLLDIKLDEEE